MRKILLLSDTHSHMDDRILSYVKAADEVWHAGDVGDLKIIDALKKYKPTRAVYGNIDGGLLRSVLKETLVFTIENVKVLMIHIGNPPQRYRPQIRELIAHHQPQLFVCGHSHILKVQYDPRYKMLYANPGAVGIHGFHQIRTMLRFEINHGKIENMVAIELGGRTP